MRTLSSIVEELETVESLPTLPVIIQELGKALRDPDSDAERVARIIEDDPSIMARILRVVNSSYYGGSRPTTSVQAAVARLGMEAVNNLAIMTAVYTSFGAGKKSRFDREEFWRHSVCTGLAATVVNDAAGGPARTTCSNDMLHLAGLMHDIGKIVFDSYYPDEFSRSLLVAEEEQIPLHFAEKRELGASHDEVGAWFARRWNLSDNIALAIRRHHDPASPDKGGDSILATICHVADYFVLDSGVAASGNPMPELEENALETLGLPRRLLPDLADLVLQQSQRSELLRILG